MSKMLLFKYTHARLDWTILEQENFLKGFLTAIAALQFIMANALHAKTFAVLFLNCGSFEDDEGVNLSSLDGYARWIAR